MKRTENKLSVVFNKDHILFSLVLDTRYLDSDIVSGA